MLLSLDLSLNETGYCVDTSQSIASGILKPPKNLTQYEKIEYNLTKILELVEANNIKLVGIEAAAYGMKSSSMNILAEQQGVIKHELRKRGVSVTEVAISSIKKYITGKGNAKKVQVIQSLRDKYNILATNHNECDAIALHLYLKSQESVITI